ncbi:hypothetical protein [Thermomonas sp. HDW16]|uniref:hypothetical protein n=1 Tax=Thermomonas sp. HDW16 TaxID=2714945 RepID=UPI00140DBA5D|nr:hypothetical protein [Thermomonas sp. HDW16]QIL21367.1 hypothetical protein G7079_11840 [Thermomonas sp. HDW16]
MQSRCKTATTGASYLLIAVALMGAPVLAEDVQFEGHTLEVEPGQGDARNIARILGTRYQINAAAVQIIDKARGCLGNQSGVAIEAGEPNSGQLVANSQVNYRAGWSTHSVRSRIAVEASDGYFRIVQSDLGVADMGAADARDGDYRVLQQDGDWEKAASTMIALEQGVIDCLYR